MWNFPSKSDKMWKGAEFVSVEKLFVISPWLECGRTSNCFVSPSLIFFVREIWTLKNIFSEIILFHMLICMYNSWYDSWLIFRQIRSSFPYFPTHFFFVKVEYFLYQSEKLQRLWTLAPLKVSWSRRVSKLKLRFKTWEKVKLNRTLQNRKIFQYLDCESSCKDSSIVYIWPALLPWGQVPASFTFL